MNVLEYLVHKIYVHTGRVSLSASNIDFKMRPYLKHRNGYFIECGANDGYLQNNTIYFEKFMGWRGLLVEPIPALAARCRQNRPASRTENCALVADDYPSSTVLMEAVGLMSQVTGARGSAEADRICIERGARNQNLQPYQVEVPARTLTSLLDEVHPPDIDFFSLDVEGYELQVLHGLDLNRYRPTFLLVEANQRPELHAFLQPYYHHVTDLTETDVLFQAR